MPTYHARLIDLGHVIGAKTFEADNREAADRRVGDVIDPLVGQWAEVRRLPEPREPLPDITPGKPKQQGD